MRPVVSYTGARKRLILRGGGGGGGGGGGYLVPLLNPLVNCSH